MLRKASVGALAMASVLGIAMLFASAPRQDVSVVAGVATHRAN
jgi:hypothetical protein